MDRTSEPSEAMQLPGVMVMVMVMVCVCVILKRARVITHMCLDSMYAYECTHIGECTPHTSLHVQA